MTRAQKAAIDARAARRAAAAIVAVYLDAPSITRAAGHRWYSEEAARCDAFARERGISADAVAGAAAAISPGMRWDTVFAHLAALYVDPAHPVPTYSREFVKRAVRCLRGEDPEQVLGGPKVTAFYRLLARKDMQAVVIDGHAWNICRLKRDCFRQREDYVVPRAAIVTPRRYRIAEAAYRMAAEDLGVLPHQVQAVTWVHWRNVVTPF